MFICHRHGPQALIAVEADVVNICCYFAKCLVELQAINIMYSQLADAAVICSNVYF